MDDDAFLQDVVQEYGADTVRLFMLFKVSGLLGYM